MVSGKTQKNKDPRFDLRTIFLANSGGLSSKRIIGVLGFAICVGLLIAGFIVEKEIPEFADMVIITSSSLLGLDSFRGLFTRSTS